MTYDGPERRRDPNGHFRGYTEAQIDAIRETLVEIKQGIRELGTQVDSLRQWRARVLGVATAAAAVVSLVVEWLKTQWR